MIAVSVSDHSVFIPSWCIHPGWWFLHWTASLKKNPEVAWKQVDFVCCLSQGQSCSDEEAETPPSNLKVDQSQFCRGALQAESSKHFGQAAFLFILEYLVLWLAVVAYRMVQWGALLQWCADSEILGLIILRKEKHHGKLLQTAKLNATCTRCFQCFLTIKLYNLCTPFYFTNHRNSWKCYIIPWEPMKTAFVQLQLTLE